MQGQREEISQVKVPWRNTVIGSELTSVSPNLLRFQNGCPEPVAAKVIPSSNPEKIIVIPASENEVSQTIEEKEGSHLELEIVVTKN